MQQYPIRSYSKYQNQLQEHTTRYTPNKYTDWHKKYEPKHKFDCQPDLQFQAQSIANQRDFQITQRRYSQFTQPQAPLNQYHSERSNKENKPNIQQNFDVETYVRRLQIKLNQRH
ncbi:unnamed protein product (macronuclear) [Paramecium tetraurelia]|uniref:Uncharacterized protein n=1 Tax=Paramecium tetraurelia TaxID=5888 RepID=A0BRL7_PARTE|nr:uncharacterized protein GSPATT00031415001 [Paramecium tetraurelia]CAK61184.1 unnamed protein product [Paramecium tetraurelia]|eukprot:XP_001428582.1 hypothetical protein (macronuclear) [Paramecium tetraurelia strain d4-2]